MSSLVNFLGLMGLYLPFWQPKSTLTPQIHLLELSPVT
ncbi:hypothetical protein CWATWH0005_1150 [Crocosphaera watsonii WH 0005]|uniref:Uncharacterized protein n=1 Tax=Crocosphaera watsonii WH 0005 TaxID=423472 RepID=T2ISZ7_CROWT|nr:hypothetical protein CWATWH0005_1150 [Crocosphaera watsonii WH 0005]